jgi:hypothetical protein
LARLVQFFAPGIPQVYYVGLLAGSNDLDLLAHTGVGHEINRHRYTAADLAKALDRPVVRALARLIRFRNTHPAFLGAFSCLDAADGALTLRWRNGPRRLKSPRSWPVAPTPSATPPTAASDRRPMSRISPSDVGNGCQGEGTRMSTAAVML